jgi:Zn-dependent M28 family amino/carboxypeptidase
LAILTSSGFFQDIYYKTLKFAIHRQIIPSMKRFLFLSALLLALFSCQTRIDVSTGSRAVDTKNMARYIEVLASDSFMGRKPLTPGEDITIAWLEKVFRDELSLEPAFDGSYLQEVPLMEVTIKPSASMTIHSHQSNLTFQNPSDFVMFSRKVQPRAIFEKEEMVFAGYGIVAPEYNWDDYRDLDVKGKVVVVLVNDPGLATADTTLFKGRSMTYYGRWTYKFEEAARQGARGLLIIHDTEGAGYPWSVVVNGASIPKLYLQSENGYAGFCDLEGWITTDAATRLFAQSGFDFNAEKLKAAQKEFTSYPLKTTLSTSLESTFAYGISHNVGGLIRGTDLAHEVIVFSAHWDHLGIGPVINGDSIYSGAVDNGTSIAWMLEIARAFQSMPKPPRRSILILAPTAEEQGLLGAYHYVNNPVFPLKNTVANFNNDLMLPLGRMKDIMITGYGQSELDDLVAEAAAAQDRYILPDPNPETGMYYRADHFAFAKAGVPALFARGNNHHRENGIEWTSQKEKEWLANNYHKPADKYDPETWNLDGVAEDARLIFRVAWKLANSETFPQWKEGSEFREIRLKQRGE